MGGAGTILAAALAAGVTGMAPLAAAGGDIGGDRHTTAVMAPGLAHPWPRGVPDGYGVFETAGDADWFRVRLAGGRDYALLALGDLPKRSVTLAGVLDAAGRVVARGGGGHAYPEGVEFRAPRTGTYFLAAAALVYPADPRTGRPPYRYDVAIVPDCRADAATACALAPGAAVTSRCDWGRDEDRFAMRLEVGRTYAISSTGARHALTVYAPDGTTPLRRAEGAGGVAVAGLVPARDGTYYAAYRCDGGGGGGYRVTLAEE